MKTYIKRKQTPIELRARLRIMGIGKYAFETSLFGKPYELNMNMPMFNTEVEAVVWIEVQKDWEAENEL